MYSCYSESVYQRSGLSVQRSVSATVYQALQEPVCKICIAAIVNQSISVAVYQCNGLSVQRSIRLFKSRSAKYV